jgi:hypothetical protein
MTIVWWHTHCIVGYALSRVIHRIQFENLFGNPDCYMKWLGVIDRPYKAWYMGRRIPPPFSVAEFFSNCSEKKLKGWSLDLATQCLLEGLSCTWTYVDYWSLCCSWTCLHYRILRCILMCQQNRGLSCTKTCLGNGSRCWSAYVYTIEAWAAPESVYTP